MKNTLYIPGASIAAKVSRQPIGFRRNGSAIWPVAGGSPTLVETLETDVDALKTERDGKVAALRTIRQKVQDEGRKEFTPEEQTAWDAAFTRVKEIEGTRDAPGELPKIEARIAELEELYTREEQAEANAKRAAGDPDETTRKRVELAGKLGDEPLTYHRHSRNSFFQDFFLARVKGNEKAQERLQRHGREMDVVYAEFRAQHPEEQRAGVVANYSGQVIPQYLVDEYAVFARAKRPFLNEVRNLPLPDQGMEMHIGKGTTGTSVAAQATENAAVSNTDYDDTDLNIPVRTYAGMQVVSRQAVERGALVDELLAEDLLSAYYTAVDLGAIASDGTSGTHKGVLSATGINAVTYTDATPTVGELYPKLADAAWNQIPTNVFAGADALFMHPRRFGWILGSVDSQGRPIAVPTAQGPMNSMAGGGSGPAYGPTGFVVAGIPTFTDANIPTNLGAGTNEDRIIAVVKREVIFWEDPDAPIQLRFDETKADQLSILFVAYGYSAFTAERRPKAVSVISGTGLITPTF